MLLLFNSYIKTDPVAHATPHHSRGWLYKYTNLCSVKEHHKTDVKPTWLLYKNYCVIKLILKFLILKNALKQKLNN